MRKLTNWVGLVGAALLIVVHLLLRGGDPKVVSAWWETILVFGMVEIWIVLFDRESAKDWHCLVGWTISAYGVLYLPMRMLPAGISEEEMFSSRPIWVGVGMFVVCLLVAVFVSDTVPSTTASDPAQTGRPSEVA